MDKNMGGKIEEKVFSLGSNLFLGLILGIGLKTKPYFGIPGDPSLITGTTPRITDKEKSHCHKFNIRIHSVGI
jgi:hypothetical protein